MEIKDNAVNGDALVRWAEDEHIRLTFDAQDTGSFKSGAWNEDYNPDLYFVSTYSNNSLLAATRKVLSKFFHSQFRLIDIEVGTQIPLIRTIPKSRMNFKQAYY